MSEEHQHEFIPVCIEFDKAWGYTTDGKDKWNYKYRGHDYTNPRFVWLACSCGLVKHVKARSEEP